MGMSWEVPCIGVQQSLSRNTILCLYVAGYSRAWAGPLPIYPVIPVHRRRFE